jgi:hypothetical protein
VDLGAVARPDQREAEQQLALDAALCTSSDSKEALALVVRRRERDPRPPQLVVGLVVDGRGVDDEVADEVA